MGKTMTGQVDVMAAFATRLEAGEDSRECAHATFPEVLEAGWLEGLGEEILSALGAALLSGEMSYDALEDAARHGLVIAFAAGMAAGRADASDAILALSEVDWDTLPDFSGEDITPDTTTGGE